MMKRTLQIAILLVCISCKQEADNIRGVPTKAAVEAEMISVQEESSRLQEEGYQTFLYEEGDSTYLMQQYYLVLLKKGPQRDQDSLQAAQLQEQHLAYLSKLHEEGYTSLTGPMGDDGDIRGIVVFNTPTLQMADSLAKLDPMVQAGRLEVEVLPWWTLKGGKLN